ncbi:hypothetical protein FK949_gp167 [Paramecium bursaria Chlorella virus NYs1]|uniref:HNH nuclease domain-containing protein n=1 Tax=Paramecium bursaria Chlorella virus NYs1 TaxID=83442 RepID=M1I3A0_9PHYC|nr:hypothetical protein FK949_gp167 [Paramecium bursaria Chlorella virus NYs1]AGE58732.1 hypothetical protein PBCVNYs1_439L [Paramecium bursaria Chlorella virus NYs1]
MKTIEYYYKDGRHEIFDKYYGDNDMIRNKKTNKEITQQLTKDGYKRVVIVSNDGKQKNLLVHRIIASTFLGAPPTLDHTPDHYNRNRADNTLDNIIWKCKKEQRANQERPETCKSAFIIVRDEVEKTSKEWVKHLENEKTPYGNVFTENLVRCYAQKKQHGFTYKEYPDLLGEVWKKIIWSLNTKGSWEISNKKRVKYKTKYADNVINVTQLGTQSGYPVICVNGRNKYVHILCFQAFYPEAYAAMKPDEIIRHRHDDPLDFRPENLLIGTQSMNMKDSHDNGKHDGKKTMRKACISYINGVKEKEHKSLADAELYLKSQGYKKASYSKIGMVLRNRRKTAYDRTWNRIIT